jgi:5-methylcytosine-specific restriction protein A
VNRYERDRRNRAAALAIHGYVCKACDLEMSDRYGPDAAGLIEVHHVTPVSEVGPGYIIDPRTDLVPLCPNCHSVAHRRSPPFSVDELRDMQHRP